MSGIGIPAVLFVERFTETPGLWVSLPTANRFTSACEQERHLIGTVLNGEKYLYNSLLSHLLTDSAGLITITIFI